MIDIRMDDRGPLVAALQILLNRYWRSSRLAVDGIFGPATRTAVKDFQRSRRLTPSGILRSASWSQLVRPGEGSIISANDIYDPRHDRFAPPALRGPGYIATAGMSGGVGQVTRDIRIAAAGLGPIVLLRFYGHGRPGLMGVTGGTGTMRGSEGETMYRDATGRELPASQRPHERWGEPVMGDHVMDRTTISNETMQAIERQLRTLRPLFAPFGSVELHGCRVGLGAAGRRLLGSLARVLGVPASAGQDSQSFGMRTAARFEGPVATVYPSGGGLRGWARRAASAAGVA